MKRGLFVLMAILLLSCCLFTGCESETVVVNVENKEDIYNSTLGMDSLVAIGDGLYYDSSTRIVYWWNGNLGSYSATTPSPYYAPNGLPYRYNPEINTLEEIEWR